MCGVGILSYFAVQAGAKKVYAVEASSMAHKIRKMATHAGTRNHWLKDKIEVISGRNPLRTWRISTKRFLDQPKGGYF